MRSVVICGSKRYREEIAEFCHRLECMGIAVFKPNIDSPIHEDKAFESNHVRRMVFKGLTLEHFDMIRKAEVCFIYNKDNYVGVSVLLEMGFACALGKPTYALEASTGDPCSDSLIDGVVPSVEALAKKMQ